MKTIQALYARHMQLLNGSLQSKQEFEEVSWVRQQLDSNVKNVEYDLKDLDETIQIVESDRASYSQFSDLEIQSRKLFVGQTRKEIKTIRDNVFSKKAQAKIEQHQRNVSTILFLTMNFYPTFLNFRHFYHKNQNQLDKVTTPC